MAVTIDEIEDFVEVFHEQNIQKIKEEDLREAIRHYWNVASQPTVDDRIETLKEESWIKKVPHSSKWEIVHEKEESIGDLFSKKREEK